MLRAPDRVARYWVCGGEVFALGGPLPLAAPGDRPSSGCRALARGDLAALADWHRRQASEETGEAARYHRLCLRDAQAVLARSPDLVC